MCGRHRIFLFKDRDFVSKYRIFPMRIRMNILKYSVRLRKCSEKSRGEWDERRQRGGYCTKMPE